MTIVYGAELHGKPGGVLCVGEAYGEHEENAEPPRPFVGPAGQILDDVAAFGGFRRQDMSYTNVRNERPPGGENKFAAFSDAQIREGQQRLDALVRRLRPKLIITLGNIPSAHFIPTWPSNGRGIVGAKGIEQRRGYFWPGKHGGWVLTMLHPATATRKAVPGYELLTRDFRRARAWLRGQLPRRTFPEVLPLTTSRQVQHLLHSRALAFDIEERWGHIVTCGFCGDDGQPYAARYGKGFDLMAMALRGRRGLQGVAHNGPYDVEELDREGFPTALYTDDTQTAWWALDPELAAQDDDEGGRMTRKSLAFLGSLDENGNWPWWKDDDRAEELGGLAGYPLDDDDDRTALLKLYVMGGRDSFITRQSWAWLYPRLLAEDVEQQYHDAYYANLACITMTRRGWVVDDTLRQERIAVLSARHARAKEQARAAALAYIEENKIADFQWHKQCPCCSGVGERCWRCAGLPAMPKRKADYAPVVPDWETVKAAELKERLPPCHTCKGRGFHAGYDFQPTGHQLRKLLYEHIGAPQWVFKRKVKMDEMARLNLMLWAKGEK